MIFKFKLLLIFLILSSLSLFSQNKDGYSLENPTFLDETVSNYDVFFMEEMHWRKENINKKKKMINYLSSKNSLDVIVVERSYAFGHWINYYLETGDTLLLKEFLLLDNFLTTKKGVVYEDEYSFYKWLRNFNIENNKTIKVIGIDMAALWEGELTLWSFLKFTDQDLDLHKKLKLNIEAANKLLLKEKISINDVKKWRKELDLAINKITTSNSQFLNYVYNLKQSVKWARGNKINFREKQIATNFKKYIKAGEKVYGQYGMGHLLLEHLKSNGMKSFTSILNKDVNYSGKILSISLICFGCDNFNQVSGEDLYPTYLTKKESEKFKPMFITLPHNTFVDFRGTNERIETYLKILLIEHN
jgi:hypothetical protein